MLVAFLFLHTSFHVSKSLLCPESNLIVYKSFPAMPAHSEYSHLRMSVNYTTTVLSAPWRVTWCVRGTGGEEERLPEEVMRKLGSEGRVAWNEAKREGEDWCLMHTLRWCRKLIWLWLFEENSQIFFLIMVISQGWGLWVYQENMT